jgi:hypothetical protein
MKNAYAFVSSESLHNCRLEVVARAFELFMFSGQVCDASARGTSVQPVKPVRSGRPHARQRAGNISSVDSNWEYDIQADIQTSQHAKQLVKRSLLPKPVRRI